MRKIFAYVVTVATLLAMMVFCIPSIKENTNFAMEYTGGFEVLYKATSTMKDVKNKDVANTISAGMSKILDINGIDESIITVEGENYIRVNVTSNNQIISDEIRDLLQNPNSFELTFRDSSDKELAKGTDLLEKVAATYTGETNAYGNPVIYLHIKKSAIDLLRDITTTISQSSDQKLIIWAGFEEGDSYANISTNSETAKKVIYNATVSEPLDEETITITGSYTEDEAKNTVNLINSGTYDYDLDIIQIKSIKENEALRSRNIMLISVAVLVFISIVAMCIIFKLEGLFSVVPVLFAEFITIFAFNKINGVINPQVIGAFIIANVVLFTLLFLLLSKYKSVLKTNKSPIKAYNETYKKNNFIILDTSITMLIFALVTYFLGNNAHQFAICLSVTSIAILVTMHLVERFALYLTCDCFNKNNRSVIVASDTTKDEKDIVTNLNLDKFTKPVFWGTIGLTTLGAIVVLITALIFKAPFTFYDDARSVSSIEIVTNDEHFTSSDEVKEFFAQDTLQIQLSSVNMVKDDNGYHVFVTSSSNIAHLEDKLKDELKELCGENTDYLEKYIVYMNDYDSSSLLITFESTVYTTGIALLAIAIYFALRYKYSYALAGVAVTSLSIVSVVAFFGVTRIPVNNSAVIGISIIGTFSTFILVPLFTKIREYMNDTKKIYLSYQERVECFKKGRSSTATTLVAATIILDALSLVAMLFNLSNFSMYIAFIVGSWFTLIYTMLFVPRIWLLLENKHDKHKKTFKNKNISKSKYRTLDEQVFIGLND